MLESESFPQTIQNSDTTRMAAGSVRIHIWGECDVSSAAEWIPRPKCSVHREEHGAFIKVIVT